MSPARAYPDLSGSMATCSTGPTMPEIDTQITYPYICGSEVSTGAWPATIPEMSEHWRWCHDRETSGDVLGD
jgi:hypothetical protein